MNTIPREEAWDADHLSDIAVALVADGEAALAGEGVSQHAESCEACAKRVGEAAVLSSRIDAGMRVVPRSLPATVHGFPAWLVAAALVLAGIGFIPGARSTIASVVSAFAALPSSSSALDSAIGLAADVSHSSLFAVATFVAAAFLLVLGFFIARGGRALSQSESSS